MHRCKFYSRKVLCAESCMLHSHFLCVFFFSIPASHQQQPMDAAVLHFLLAHRQLLRAQHVCRGGGRKFPQMPATSGGRGGPPARREAAEAPGEEASE